MALPFRKSPTIPPNAESESEANARSIMATAFG